MLVNALLQNVSEEKENNNSQNKHYVSNARTINLIIFSLVKKTIK